MSKFMKTLKHEIVEAIPPAIFFFFAFHLLAFTQVLMEKEYAIDVSTIMNATIGALVVAKVVLLSDLLPMVNRFPEKPLVYNVVWKAVIYQIAAILVIYLERLWDAFRDTGSLAAANAHMVESIVWPHLWAVLMWLMVLFLLYCTLRELARAIGEKRMRAYFFGPLPD